MKTPISLRFMGNDRHNLEPQEFEVWLESAKELNPNFLASLREHLGKSMSIYIQALANGVDEKEAKKLLPMLLADRINH